MELERRVEKKIGRRDFLKSGLFVGLLGVSGCGINLPGPGGRLGCAPNATSITAYLGENAAKKQRGIAYTCKAGNIDIAHVRKYAEWTEYFAKLSSVNLEKQKSEFSFKGREPGKYNIQMKYAGNFVNLNENERKKMIKDISIEIGQNLAYTMSLWHETLTWFGWKYTGIIPEFNSAFSWEDRFSDTFGCYIGGLALKKEGSFQKELNIILESELNRLGVQPRAVTKKAINNVKGDWFGGKGFDSDMNIRNLDIGIDGFVTPPVPPTRECEGIETWLCPIPNLNLTKKYGFEVKVEIAPSRKEGDKILRVAGKQNRINVETDFPKVMEYIKEDAISRGYRVIY